MKISTSMIEVGKNRICIFVYPLFLADCTRKNGC